MSFLLGIDPGVKNLGYALLTQTGDGIEVVETRILDPSSYFTERDFVSELNKSLKGKPLCSVTIERFVSFGGTSPREAEFINIIVGGLICTLPISRDTLLTRIRSIDWKMALVKALVKQRGFSNPSSSLDKKFSIAAANACLTKPLERKITDHEADAICLAAFPIFCPDYLDK